MPNRTIASGPSFRADVITACLVGAFVGLIGLWPHLSFANEIGEFRFFQGAYDEDSYVLSWLRGTLRSTRALSGFGLSILHAITSASLDATMALADVVFPFVATCAAYFAASQVVASKAGRVLAALLLVFANDLFSLGDLALWTNGRFNIFAFAQAVSLFGPNLVPSYETSFLAVFRTPEPQVSFTLMFLVLGMLARFAIRPDAAGPMAAVTLIAALSLLPLGYTFITAPVAALAFGSLIVFVSFRLRAAATATALGLFGAIAVALVASFWQPIAGQSTTGLAAGLSFQSRAPIVTPAVIGSLILSAAFGAWMLWHGRRRPLAYLALGCLLLPFALSNQQIVSGVMISARDWERNVSYPLLVFGALAALSLLVPRAKAVSGRGAIAVWALAALCAGIIWHAQLVAIRMWKPQNLEAIAIVRALQAVDPRLREAARLTFANPGISQSIQVRMGDAVTVPLSFYDVAISFIPNMLPDAAHADPSPFEALVFEYMLRTGVGPEQVEQLLRTEISHRAGTFLNYLFSFRDGWYPASDNRAFRKSELENSVKGIVDRYRAYLSAADRNTDLKGSALLIAKVPSTVPTHGDRIAGGEAPGVVVQIYEQQPVDALVRQLR